MMQLKADGALECLVGNIACKDEREWIHLILDIIQCGCGGRREHEN